VDLPSLDLPSLHLDFWTTVGWLAIGLVVGAIARFLIPGDDPVPFGCLGTAVLGVVGSFVGGIITNVVRTGQLSMQLHPSGFLGSLVGAIALLLLLRLTRG
jgi:uncharacterized membrane protein YeaQ/YmgE (transglycosylase-associated protein family)